MTSVALLVIIVLLEEVTVTIGIDVYSAKDWEDYLNNEADFFSYDKDKARTAKDDSARIETLVTEHYDEPRGFSTEFTSEAPFVALLYNDGLVENSTDHVLTWKKDFFKVGSICGGAIVTSNVVLTLCVCVETLVFDNAKYRGELKDLTLVAPLHDLGKDPYVVPFAERMYYTHADRGYEPTPYKFKINKLGEGKVNQYSNRLCIDNYHKGSDRQVNEDTLSTTHAILEFSPRFVIPVPEWYAPWPPHTYQPPYERGEAMWYRPRTTVSIYSYGFGLQSPVVYRTAGGEAVNVPHSLMKLRLTRCDFLVVNYCVRTDDFHPENPTALGCFCDNAADRQSLCGGLIGSPVMYKGLLFGLLAERVPCRAETPRSAFVKGFTNEIIRRFSNAVPDLYYKMHNINEQNAFRINGSQLVEYTLFFPPADIDQGIHSDLEISEDEIEQIEDTGKYKENPEELKKLGLSCSLTVFTPSVFVGALHIFILSLISNFS